MRWRGRRMVGAVIGEGTSTYLRVNVWRGQAEHLADSLAQGQWCYSGLLGSGP
jgi:single-stranded DNA-binding protein